MQELTTIQKILLLWLALQPIGLILAPPCMPVTLIIRLRSPKNQKSSSLPSYSILVIHIHQCSSITVSRCTETYFGEFFEHQQEIGNCEGEYCSHLQGKRCRYTQVILVYHSVFYKIEDYWIFFWVEANKQRTTHESSVHGFSPYHTAVDNWHATQW